MRSFILMALCFSFSFAQQKYFISDLEWLSGFWRMEMRVQSAELFWTPIFSEKMEGSSITKKDGKITEQESILIYQDSLGNIFYRSKPSTQKETRFTLVKLDSTYVVFENLKHDFPQRIIYRKGLSDSLIATMEGTVKGKLRRVTFPYKKVMIDPI